jgi:hypothetical protein
MYAVLVDQGQLYTDLTGKLPVRSSKGNSYVLVCYIDDCNYDQELIVKVCKPKLQTLDNEASTALKNFFTVNDIAYQLVLPQCHRRNSAERAIRTLNEHFVSGLPSVDPSFPLHWWDRLLPQAEITLDLLQTSRLHPHLSTAAHYHGLVGYSKTAFAPPRYKIIAHEKPGKRQTWAPHG